ncbi:MAG: helix-turn-helix domain protein [Firmicutes bacterium]|nr:helix-turn-helix domain protein [Bacillota bacterium]
MTTVGSILRELRILKNKTQKEVFQDTGIHNKTLSGYENNVSEPDFDTIKTLAVYYETTTDYILGKINNKISTVSGLEEKKPKDLKKILEQHEIMFSGTPLNDEDKQAILDIVELQLYKRAKELNKRKKPGSDFL